MLNNLKISFQYVLPKILITRLVGWISKKRAGWLTKLAIDLFIKYYKINMQEVKEQNIANYNTFNDFFVRELKDGVHILDNNPKVLVMPADGTISQFGKIEGDKILQAKGYNYNLESLLAGNHIIANKFKNGIFATIYLSPQNYHRIHMPCDGAIREIIYVPGDLFSVNYLTCKKIPNLFARNERAICLFDTKFGPIVLILIGACITGNIETVWTGPINSLREGIIKRWTWSPDEDKYPIKLAKGQEMGRFNLGSTVINLFTSNRLNLVNNLKKLSVTKIGEPLAIYDEALNIENIK